MRLNYIHACTMGLAMTLATHNYVNAEVTFKKNTSQSTQETTRYDVDGNTASKPQLAELFNIADRATCPDNPSDEGCYTHANPSNIKIKKNETYITVQPLNGDVDTIHYKIPGLLTESGLTFKRTTKDTFKVEFTPLTARDISDLFDAWDLQHKDQCDNTGVNNYHQTKQEQYIEANCQTKPSSRNKYTKIDYSHPAVKKLLAKEILPGAYKTKKVGKKTIVTLNKRTPTRLFLSELENMCERLDMNCHALLNVMYFETGGTYDPQKKNPVGSATGLIQFIQDTAKDLGTTTTKLRAMSALEQLEYVELYFKEKRDAIQDARRTCDYRKPKDIALAVFYPGAVGRPDDFIIGQKQRYQTKKVKKGKKEITIQTNKPLLPIIARYKQGAYRQNAGLDKNKDGKITAIEYVSPSLTRGGF